MLHGVLDPEVHVNGIEKKKKLFTHSSIFINLENPTHSTNRANRTINIWQQNINKSRICQHDLINSARQIEQDIDIIALQEPAISDFAVTIASRDWRVIYPTTHTKFSSKIRTVMLIRADILTNSWSQTEINSGDVTVVMFTGN